MLYGNDLEMKKKQDFFSALPSACFKPPESQLFFVFEVPILQLFSAILPSRETSDGSAPESLVKVVDVADARRQI